MYKVIRSHPSQLEIYQNKLLESGHVTKEDIERIQNKVNNILNEEFIASKDYVPKRRDWLSAYWTGFKSPEQVSRIRNTGVNPEILKNIGKAITTLPENFKAHRAVKKIFADRAKMIETGEGIDWAVGEALAFATLLVEGNHVRLSGQDVERGTFSHRHSVLHDQETGKKYCPLDHVVTNQNEEMFTVSNSSLSEFGVLGFELGYSMENPNSLVLWEAQFGDFSNGARVMFDQFLSSGEAKWLRQTGLVVLLPHGYDGQGPEHSSARLERFLQTPTTRAKSPKLGRNKSVTVNSFQEGGSGPGHREQDRSPKLNQANNNNVSVSKKLLRKSLSSLAVSKTGEKPTKLRQKPTNPEAGDEKDRAVLLEESKKQPSGDKDCSDVGTEQASVQDNDSFMNSSNPEMMPHAELTVGC